MCFFSSLFFPGRMSELSSASESERESLALILQPRQCPLRFTGRAVPPLHALQSMGRTTTSELPKTLFMRTNRVLPTAECPSRTQCTEPLLCICAGAADGQRQEPVRLTAAVE